MLLFAQAAEGLGSSTGILGIILGGALLTAFVGAYKFVVNIRTTERGLSRQRVRDANKGERRAIYEGTLWQNRCADLEYLLRSRGIPYPPMNEELRKLVDDTTDEPLPAVHWDNDNGNQGGGEVRP